MSEWGLWGLKTTPHRGSSALRVAIHVRSSQGAQGESFALWDLTRNNKMDLPARPGHQCEQTICSTQGPSILATNVHGTEPTPHLPFISIPPPSPLLIWHISWQSFAHRFFPFWARKQPNDSRTMRQMMFQEMVWR